jgi:hypothetical protein
MLTWRTHERVNWEWDLQYFLKAKIMLTNSKHCKSVIIIIASDHNCHTERR